MSQASLPQKIVVVGSSCAGKTTLSRQLARISGLKRVELDALSWNPNWVEADLDVFRARVREALHTDGWVVDGNYESKAKDLIWTQADMVVWLDLGLWLILKRFFARSIRRSLTREVLWDGCQESFRNSIFKKDSLLVWILSTFKGRREKFTTLFAREFSGLQIHRLQSPKQVQDFLKEFEDAWAAPAKEEKA